MGRENVHDVLDALNDCLRHHNLEELSPQCRALLEVLWQQPGLSNKKLITELAKNGIHLGEGHLRNISSQLWKTMGRVMNATIDKKRVINELARWHRIWQAQGSSLLSGRDGVITEIIQQLPSGRFSVICVTGMLKVGKTEILKQAISSLLRDKPGSYRWFQASDCATVKDLLSELGFASEEAIQSISIHSAVNILLKKLRQQALVIILDDADILYVPKQYPGTLHDDSGYERFLRRMVEDPTIESKLVWISRVCPTCLDEGSTTLRRIPLDPLSADQALLLCEKQQNRRSTRQDWHRLIKFCGYNPGLISPAVRRINDSFGGRVGQFIEEPLRGFSSANTRVRWHEANDWHNLIETLSEDEQALLIWIMLRPLSYRGMEDLRTRCFQLIDVGLARDALLKRELIALDHEGLYQIQPPYFCYVLANWLIHSIDELIKTEDVRPLMKYALTLPLGAAWRQHWHHKYILKPFWGLSGQSDQLQPLLKQARCNSPSPAERATYGYAVGTLLNIAAVRQWPLSVFDIAGLTIRCADLRQADLRNADLTSCTFKETALPVAFTGKLVADMSADGSMIAIGDEEGRLGCWVRHVECFMLEKYHRLGRLPQQSVAVQKLAYVADELLVSAGESIYRWALEETTIPQFLMAVNDEVRCLGSEGDLVAVGLANGRVFCHDLFGGTNSDQGLHTHPVSFLALEPDGHQLATVGNMSRVVLWEVHDGIGEAPQCRQIHNISTEDQIIQAIQWQDNNLLVASTTPEGQPALLNTLDGQWHPFPAIQGIIKLTFSRNGRFLVGIDGSGTLYRWQNGALAPLRPHLDIDHLEFMAVSDDGRTLLTTCHSHPASKDNRPQVQLWDVENGHLLWELKTNTPEFMQGLQLTDVHGVTEAQMQHLIEFAN